MKDFINGYVEPKFYFNVNQKTKLFTDNEILATIKFANGVIELIYYKHFFEIYFRPYQKSYGYFLYAYDDLYKALLHFENKPKVEIEGFIIGRTCRTPYLSKTPYWLKKESLSSYKENQKVNK